jgi:hypothetical protein
MTTPEHSPLPWAYADGFIRDANGKIVDMREVNAHLIVAAVDSHADLLAAAKAIYLAVHGDDVAVGPLWGRLHAAIAAAEEPAP